MSDKVLEVNGEGTANVYKFVLTKGCYVFDLEWFSLKFVYDHSRLSVKSHLFLG